MLLSLCTLAWALEPGDQLVLDLVGQAQIQGSLKEAGPDSLVLTGTNQETLVRLLLVEGAQVNGQAMDAMTLRAEAEDLYRRQTIELARLSQHSPHPAAVFSASMLWPGVGHLMLNERAQGWGYAGLELMLLSTGVFFAYTENYQSLAGLMGVDLLFRTYAVADATGKAKRRRARLAVSHTRQGTYVSLTLPIGLSPSTNAGAP